MEAFLASQLDYRFFFYCMAVLAVVEACLATAYFVSRRRGEELRLASLRLADEKRLRDVTSALGEGVYVLDGEGRLIFMNPEAERLLGWSESELMGRDMHETIHFQNKDGSRNGHDGCPALKTMKTGVSVTVEDDVFIRKDGTPFPVSYVAAPRFEGGMVSGVVSAFRDITERKKSEMERKRAYDSLRKNQERFAGAEAVAHFGSWEWRVLEDKVYWSDGMCRIFGIDPEEFDGTYQSYLDFVHPDDLKLVMDQVLKSATTFCPLGYNARVIRRDGELRVVHVQGEVTLGGDGNPVSMLGTVQDITERHAAEEEVRKFRFIVDGAGEVIFLADKDANIVYANPAAAKSLGYTQEEITRLRVQDFDPGVDVSKWQDHFAERKAGDSPLFESTHLSKDGRTIPVEITSVYMDMGGEGYVCGFVRDISERKALDSQRSDFYAMITHDLKSPLTVILGNADLMIDDGPSLSATDVQEMAVSIKASGRKLFRMVDDFLAISRLEAGKATFNECPVDVAEMLAEMAVEASALAKRKGQSFSSDIEKGLPMSILDKTHVYRAVANLIQNAVNYTPEGGSINLKADILGSEGGEYIKITVSDNGPGILAEEREKIFDKYYRSPRTSKARGSGLGLAVVKAVATVHGGHVELKSVEGKGSEFSLVLPVRRAS